MTRRGLKVQCTISHLPRSVPHDIALALFRVVQDALNDLGNVRIDDSDAGLRLLKMRERVAMVNGTFSIASPSERGTEIEIRIPLAGH